MSIQMKSEDNPQRKKSFYFRKKTSLKGDTYYYICGVLVWRRKKTASSFFEQAQDLIKNNERLIGHALRLMTESNEKQNQIFDLLNANISNVQNTVENNKNEIIEYVKKDFTEEIIKLLLIQSQHQKTFSQFKNLYQGKEIALVACGPTLSTYKPIKDVIHIGVNRSFRYDSLDLDYLFMQDYQAVGSYLEEAADYNTRKCKKFYGLYFYEGRTSIPLKYSENENSYLYYLLENDISFYVDIASAPMPQFASVIFAAAAFALYTNPKRIYLVGCDATEEGYFDGDEQKEARYMPLVKDGWGHFKDFVETRYPETEIVSINPVGLKGMFKDIYTTND